MSLKSQFALLATVSLQAAGCAGAHHHTIVPEAEDPNPIKVSTSAKSLPKAVNHVWIQMNETSNSVVPSTTGNTSSLTSNVTFRTKNAAMLLSCTGAKDSFAVATRIASISPGKLDLETTEVTAPEVCYVEMGTSTVTRKNGLYTCTVDMAK